MFLAVPYICAAAICTTSINDGGPGWLYLLVLLSIWNAFKMLLDRPRQPRLARAEQAPKACQRPPIRSDTQAGFFDLTPAP